MTAHGPTSTGMNQARALNPVLAFCPYLNLREPCEIGNWTLSPVPVFAGPWLSDQFEARCRQFLAELWTRHHRPK